MPTPSPLRPLAPSQRGLWTILALFALGLLFLAGLYLTAYLDTPAEYRQSTPGIPGVPITVASANLRWQPPPDEFLGTLRSQAVDVLLLQRVSRKEAERMADALGMRSGGRLQVAYSPANLGQTDEPGNAILSKYPLFKARSVPRPKYPANPNLRPPQNFGIWAEVVLKDRRFLAGSMDLTSGAEPLEVPAMVNAWRAIPQMPLVVASNSSESAQFSVTALHRSATNSIPGGNALFVSEDWPQTRIIQSGPGDVVIVELIPATASPTPR